jgi:hypothetical protein
MNKLLAVVALATAFVSTDALAIKKTPPAKPVPKKKPPVEEKEKPATATQGNAPTKEELEALMKSTDDIAKSVSKLRGLPVKNAIVRSIMTRDDIMKRILLRMGEDQTDDEMHAEERVYKRLGLLERKVDYKQLSVDLLTEQIAGFYDPDVKQLYLADWIPVEEQRMVMAHEIDHALQDQAFDLLKFMKADKDNGDAQLARQALVEGDGVALMIEFMLGEKGGGVDAAKLWENDTIVNMMSNGVTSASSGEKFDKAPLFMKDALMFPYLSGLKFIARIRKTQKWSAIDAVFAKPPASTEQIMHPDKYDAGEAPVVVKLDPKKLASLKGWTKTYSNTVGELLFSVLLRQHGVDDATAATAAAGWGGDTLIALSPKKTDTDVDSLVVIDVSAWDTENDAKEAFAAVTQAITKLAGADKADTKDDYSSVKDSSGAVFFTERKGKRLSIVIGAPAKIAAKLRADVLK